MIEVVEGRKEGYESDCTDIEEEMETEEMEKKENEAKENGEELIKEKGEEAVAEPKVDSSLMEVDPASNENAVAAVKPEEAKEETIEPTKETEEVKPETEIKTETEEKPIQEEKIKHKSVRKYFGPDEDIYIMDAMTQVLHTSYFMLQSGECYNFPNFQGNIGRYLNHSCDPNVFVQNVFVESHDLRCLGFKSCLLVCWVAMSACV